MGMGGQVDLGCTGGLEVDWQTPGVLGGLGVLGVLRCTPWDVLAAAEWAWRVLVVIWVCGELLSTRTHIRRGC